MPNPICPFATLIRGADWADNDDRLFTPQFAVEHTTEGFNSIGLGATRHHNTPGTFHLLTQPGRLFQFYPVNVRATHCAGGNNGVGIENEGFVGQSFPDEQLEVNGKVAWWLWDEWGIPLTYATGDPRVWVDVVGWSGHLAHRKVAYPPIPAYQHQDELDPAEWARGVALGAPSPPEEEEVMAAQIELDAGALARFTRGTDDQLWVRLDDGPWVPRGGVLTGGPSAIQRKSGDVVVLARGKEKRLYELVLDAALNVKAAWRYIGGQSN